MPQIKTGKQIIYIEKTRQNKSRYTQKQL